MQLCFFEDSFFSCFHPLTLTRPVDDLRIGIATIREKWAAELGPSNTTRLLRKEFDGIFEAGAINSSKPCIWINSRYFPGTPLLKKILDLKPGSCLQHNDLVVAARVDGTISSEWLSEGKTDFHSLPVVETGLRPTINHLWDLFLLNGNEIAADIKRLHIPQSKKYSISKHAILENQEQIIVGEGAKIEPGVILIAENGPVYIGNNATIKAGAMIRGPVAICDGAVVKMGAKIYEATTIGPVCKAGGEINNSIFHSYSNKGHEGYIGNSLIGQWCNLGADTNTSNLKNNYSNIRMTDWKTRRQMETGQQFIGAIMGDHSKTAINVQLNAGTVCGVSCNIFTSGFPPKFIPSFTWADTGIQPYKFDKAMESMQRMMNRRQVEMTESYKKLMEYLFETSRD